MKRAPATRRALLAAAMLVCGASLLPAGAARARSPQLNYILHCQGCHLPDGSGAPPVVPALKGFVGRFLLVPGGREYLIRVPGSSMSPLSDADLAAVLNWMVRRFGPSAVAEDFVAFGAEEVARVRRPPLTEVERLRAELVAAMP